MFPKKYFVSWFSVIESEVIVCVTRDVCDDALTVRGRRSRVFHQDGNREMTGIALCLRESDLAARVGPDAFLVLLPATSHGGARLAAERFLAGLRQHRVQLDEQSVGVTATGAVVTFPDDGDTAEELTVLANRLVTEAARVFHIYNSISVSE